MQNWGDLVRPPLHGLEVGIGGGSLFSSNLGPDQQMTKNKDQLPDGVCVGTRVSEILPGGLARGAGQGVGWWALYLGWGGGWELSFQLSSREGG